MSLSGTDLMARFSGSAASASSFVAGYWSAVLIFLAPYLHFLFLGALDASLAHLPVVLYLRFRKFSIFPEYDIEAEADHAEAYKCKCREKNFHP